MTSAASLGPEYFESIYRESPDPWDFATSPYEREKYAATLAALGRRRFAAAFEIGCSIGVLTARFAERCDTLLAIDINDRALGAARQRCAGSANVRFARMTFPHQAPPERFDLVVVSEVGYYWSDRDLLASVDWIANHAAGGIAVLVHFLPRVDDYVRDGDAVHAAFLDDGRFTLRAAQRAERYRIDVLAVA